MIRTQQQLKNTADTFTDIFAEALLAAAVKQPTVAASLQAAIFNMNWQPATSTTNAANASIQLSEVAAVATAQWLLHTINEKNHPHTTARLAAWADSYEAPKDAVIGIIGIAIMGPTLGILDKPKKKKKAELPVIIEAAVYKKMPKAKLATLTSELAQQVHASELRSAGGNAYRMHPDTAEWSFEAGTVAIYTASSHIINSLKSQLPGALIKSNEDELALACSPAIAEFVTDEYCLERVS